ncbi:MAG: glycosyltransferase family 4 protein [Bacteroidales bacterium]|nr:glycosyltransferase family 4 protein [Bacteroidales bacterium]
MNSDQILIISFWNPTARHPQQGIFIQEQAAAVCDMRENIIFLQVNILPSRNIFLKKTYEDSAYFKNKRITINLYSRLWKFWYVNPWSVSRIILRLIRKNKGEIAPAIIHANVIFPCGVAGYLLARKLGARLLISEHWSKTGKLLGHPLYKRIAMKAYLYSFALICVSEFLSERLSRSTGHKNLIVIPNIIDTDIYSYKQKPTSVNASLSMVCIANWKLPKRLDLIIESLISFASESSLKIELTVVGNGPQADMLRKRETPENLKIRWTGYLDRSAIAPLLQGANIFLHASDIETFSIVTAEALSTGTPVLASNTGALPELINEQNGILVENNHESWLNGIRDIVTKKYDYEVIAHQNQNKYSPRQIGNRILSIYDSINTGKS